MKKRSIIERSIVSLNPFIVKTVLKCRRTTIILVNSEIVLRSLRQTLTKIVVYLVLLRFKTIFILGTQGTQENYDVLHLVPEIASLLCLTVLFLAKRGRSEVYNSVP